MWLFCSILGNILLIWQRSTIIIIQIYITFPSYHNSIVEHLCKGIVLWSICVKVLFCTHKIISVVEVKGAVLVTVRRTNQSERFKKVLFQRSLLLRITTLLSWLKSTLLLKIKCFDTTIYMKTQCLQANETQHYDGKERCLRSGVGKREGSVN